MPSLTDCHRLHIDNTYLLYDAVLLAEPSVNVCNPGWLEQHGEISAVSSGRGEAWFVNYAKQQWVLRHYMRGGLVAHFNKQSYLGWQIDKTRAGQEWHLLQWMLEKNLPVPKPVAACVHWPYGRLTGVYQAYILLQRLAATKTMAACLNDQLMSDDRWRAVGQCVRRFHQHNVYHADLNANNILIDDAEKVYLIDFDRGQVRKHGAWKQGNLKRLKRSLLKLQAKQAVTDFTEDKWSLLMLAYEENIYA